MLTAHEDEAELSELLSTPSPHVSFPCEENCLLLRYQTQQRMTEQKRDHHKIIHLYS